jgi:nucleoside-diphosphate-sugar epimerase
VRPDLVFHLAGTVTAQQDLQLVIPMVQNDLVGSLHVLLAAKEVTPKRTVIVGSLEEPAPGLAPASPYAAANAAASLYTRMFHQLYNLPTVPVRPSIGYGPFQSQSKLIPTAVVGLLRGDSPQLTSGRRVCDFIYAADVARGLLQASLHHGVEGEVLDLGTGQGTSIREVVELLVEITGSSARPNFGALPDRVAESPLIADVHKCRQLLGWAAQWSLRDGLAVTVEWYRRGLCL